MWQAWQLFEKFDPDYIAFEGKFLENDKNFRSEKAFLIQFIKLVIILHDHMFKTFRKL